MAEVAIGRFWHFFGQHTHQLRILFDQFVPAFLGGQPALDRVVAEENPGPLHEVLAINLSQLSRSSNLPEDFFITFLHLFIREGRSGSDDSFHPNIGELRWAFDECSEVDELVKLVIKLIMDGEGCFKAYHLLLFLHGEVIMRQEPDRSRRDVLEVSR